MRTRISARWVIGYDPAVEDHVIYEHGNVVYAGNTIESVGQGATDPVDVHIDAGDAVVTPGFIDLDALVDIDHAILDTFQPRALLPGLEWSEAYFEHDRHDVFSRSEEALRRKYGLVQLLLNGVTTAMPIAAETHKGWAETLDEALDMAAIGAELGIRLYLGPAYRSGVNVVRADGTPTVAWDPPLGEEGLHQAVEFVRRVRAAGDSRVRGALLPCRIETCTVDLLRATHAAQAELDCPLRIHAAQGQQEVSFLAEWYGRRPIDLLAEVGLLGPRTSIPHVTLGTPDEVAQLAETGTTVIHCPLTSIRHGHALQSFDRYRRAGVNMAIGTDTFPPDMLRVLDYGSNLAKLVDGDRSAGAAADFFRAATLGGARALGRDDLGRLAPGARADLVVFDLNGLRSGPLDDPIRTLLYQSGGHQVSRVIVDGCTVVDDGRVCGVDAERLRRDGQAYFDKMKSAYPERDFLRRPTETLFPPSFAMRRQGEDA
jgi:cytosine/adenosine deaminase-related metal-dependent hydrolase